MFKKICHLKLHTSGYYWEHKICVEDFQCGTPWPMGGGFLADLTLVIAHNTMDQGASGPGVTAAVPNYITKLL